ncbi:hypothetical protein BGZ97_009913, partial [Linnemannia gamsii]
MASGITGASNNLITEGATTSAAGIMEPTAPINPAHGGTDLEEIPSLLETVELNNNIEDNGVSTSSQEMEVDSDTGIVELYPDTPPTNFREVATNTLINLKTENITLSEQIIAVNKDKERENAQLIKQLESSLYELRMKTQSGSVMSAHSPILSPTAATTAIAANTQQAAIKPTSDMPRFSLNPTTAYETNETRVFLERFSTHLKTRLGMDTFENECHRYLIVLTNDDHYQQELQRRFAAIEGTIGWDMAEKVFLSICLTQEERLENMRNMADMGRNVGESYNRYSARILRHAR